MKKQELEKVAEMLGGLLVLGALPGSPTAEAGLRYGDILLSINGQPVPDWSAYIAITRERARTQVLRIFREGSELELTVALPDAPPAADHRALVRSLVKSGALVKDSDGALAWPEPLPN